MSYTALYRKFRPDNFSDVKGQEHIVTTLKNQIKASRLGHAYLFCGTRGTGKTTVAKILAKAVNCENPDDGSPCNQCPSCKAISAGASMNVIEIDAASNNGVDNIREIRDEVQYPPTEGNYKVYIIDEVHMLSIGAFNALLKTLEEPPSYVIFILATTEAHKLPVTILSRCQRYDFKRISLDVIAERIEELTEKENVEIEERAVRYIAKAADGALRDALSLLDQCIAFYLGEKLTYDHVLEVLGAVDTGIFSEMLRCMLSGDTIGAIEKLEEIVMSGRDISQYVTDFTWYLRNLLLVLTSHGDAEDIIDVTSERMEALKEEAAMTDADTLMRYIRILSELSNQLKFATSKRVLVEIAIIKMMKPMMEYDASSMVARVSAIEKKLESGELISMEQLEKLKQSKQQNTQENEIGPVGNGARNGANTEDAAPKLNIAVPEEVKAVVSHWNEIEKELSPLSKNYMRNGRFSSQGDNRLVVQFTDSVAYGLLNKPEEIQAIQDAIAKVDNVDVRVEFKLLADGEKIEDHFVELTKKINMEIVEEDF